MDDRAFLELEYFESKRSELGVRWGRPLRVHDEVSSTNDLAMDAAVLGMLTGGVFVARSQTGGRGRRGSAWSAQPGKNLTFSLVLRLPLTPERIGGLSLVAGLALAKASEDALLDGVRAPRVTVKWPNDVYVNDEKLAGILVELRAQPGETLAIVGIGWNVAQTDFPKDAGNPTSLRLQGLPERPYQKEDLLLEFLRQFETRTSSWLTGGIPAIHDELKERDALYGRAIVLDGERCIARGIADNGALLVGTLGGGSVREVWSGHIQLIRD